MTHASFFQAGKDKDSYTQLTRNVVCTGASRLNPIGETKMVDAISSANSGASGYAPYQSSGRQGAASTTITVETDEETATAQIDQGGKKTTVSYASYTESVTININTGNGGAASGSTAGSSAAGGNSKAAQAQEGQQALATVEQTTAEAQDFLKNDAKAKLQIALNELKLLKLLGNTPAGAKEAAQIAKQIADASSEYAAGGGADIDSADGAAAGATDGTADGSTAAAGNATAATTGDTAVSGTGAAGTTTAAADTTSQTTASGDAQAAASGDAQSPAAGTASSAASNPGATPADQDPFFQEVQAALKQLKKYLQKTLPALEASPDKKTRDLAKKVEKSFNDSVAQIGQAEADFNTETDIEQAASGSAALGGTDSAASAAASVVAAVYQPVNISV